LQKPYKLEVFDRNINFRDFSVLSDQPIYFDYLTLEKTKIISPKIAVEKGDFIHITDFYGNVAYQGTVDDYEYTKTAVEIVIKPLLSLFDITAAFDRTYLVTGTLEGFIAGIITDTYINNSDSLQNITGLTVQVLSNTYDTKLNLKSNIHELYDIVTKAFTVYGIIIAAELLPQTKEVKIKIHTVNSDPVVIEAKLKNIIEKNIAVADNFGQLNKITLINKNNEAESVTYYLHSDGTISTIDTDRVTPVFSRTEYVESEEFIVNAEKRATEAMMPQKYNNLIELTYAITDKLLSLENLAIGTPVLIIDDENYNSILTGFEKTENVIKLIFGIVRIDLTKKLILEKRSVSTAGNKVAEYDTVIPKTGWITSVETWTFVSADPDVHTFVVSASGNMIGKISMGYKIKLTHSGTIKYFKVSAIGPYSGGATQITLYGGTDYALTGTDITNVSYSSEFAPVGFPMDSTKWIHEVTINSNQPVSNPQAGVWSQAGNLQIDIPIGTWELFFKASFAASVSATSNIGIFLTLSTTTNSETDGRFTQFIFHNTGYAANQVVYFPISVSHEVTVTQKTRYRILLKPPSAVNAIAADGGYALIVIKVTPKF
jgi:hypothetical protein